MNQLSTVVTLSCGNNKWPNWKTKNISWDLVERWKMAQFWNRERGMSEGRSHWIQHQDINTADRSLSEWFNKNNSRASTPLSDFSAIIRKKSLWISVEYSSHSLFLLITDNLFMLWSLMAHVYCVEWKTKKFQEFIVGQFRAKFGHVIQAPVMLIITVQCTLYCSVFKNYFLFPPL